MTRDATHEEFLKWWWSWLYPMEGELPMEREPMAQRMIMLGPEPGYIGCFTRDSAAGAMPNGTRVIKAKQEPRDGTPLGTEGIVIGSIHAPEVSPNIMYFIEWDNRPKIIIACADWKLGKALVL